MNTSSAAVSQSAHNAERALDIERLRGEFPALHQEVHGKQLVYLDNAATTQKPRVVIDALTHYYEHDNSNVHRGVHTLSERATDAYEGTRGKIARVLGVDDPRRVIYTRGATEALNLVAYSYVEPRLKAGDEILVTLMEHHSNIVPWQLLAERTGAVLRAAPILEDGALDVDAMLSMINERTRIVSVVHVSNSLGTVNPVAKIIQAAHSMGVPVMVDGAQSTPHMDVNIDELDADFFVFSGHKVYGPTGIGALIAKMERLEEMRPYQSGGDMIRKVSFSGSTWNDIPYRFEAGTPHISGGVALGAAMEFVESTGLADIAAHESALLTRALANAANVPGLKVIGRAPEHAGALSFVMDGIHPHDVGTILDTEGIAVRAGHHCTMPVMEHFGLPATTRASFALYNTLEEVDALFAGLEKVRDLFR
jgi:cysteine desulfurase/selenocysteine lyase